MTTRESRTQETRAAEVMHENYNDNWESPALLDTRNIPARPGFVQRWVRTQMRGQPDVSNIFRKENQGWRRRDPSSVAKGRFVPTVHLDGKDYIGIQGMVLMERPKELHDKHAEYIRKQSHHQMTAAKENLFNVHKDGSGLTRPSMRNETAVSKGRLADPDDD